MHSSQGAHSTSSTLDAIRPRCAQRLGGNASSRLAAVAQDGCGTHGWGRYERAERWREGETRIGREMRRCDARGNRREGERLVRKCVCMGRLSLGRAPHAFTMPRFKLARLARLNQRNQLLPRSLDLPIACPVCTPPPSPPCYVPSSIAPLPPLPSSLFLLAATLSTAPMLLSLSLLVQRGHADTTVQRAQKKKHAVIAIKSIKTTKRA